MAKDKPVITDETSTAEMDTTHIPTEDEARDEYEQQQAAEFFQGEDPDDVMEITFD